MSTEVHRPLTEKEKYFVKTYVQNGFDAIAASKAAGLERIRSSLMKRSDINEAIEKEKQVLIQSYEDEREEKRILLWQIIKDKVYRDHPKYAMVAIKAIAELNKMQGHYAPIKMVNANFNLDSNDVDRIAEMVKSYEREF